MFSTLPYKASSKTSMVSLVDFLSVLLVCGSFITSSDKNVWFLPDQICDLLVLYDVIQLLFLFYNASNFIKHILPIFFNVPFYLQKMDF